MNFGSVIGYLYIYAMGLHIYSHEQAFPIDHDARLMVSRSSSKLFFCCAALLDKHVQSQVL